MVKNNTNSSHLRTLVLIFVEGDTEVEFYKRLISHLRLKVGGRLSCEVKIQNIKGVGNYQSIAKRIFEKKIKIDYPSNSYLYKIFLSYDTDVFEFSKKPAVQWESVISMFKSTGADDVTEIQAIRSIEDWFLYDQEGIRAFLKLSKQLELSEFKGLPGLRKLFHIANKTYIKGTKSAELVNSLDMNKIFPKICHQIQPICKAIGIDCSCTHKLCL